MGERLLLSILTPAVPSRFDALDALCSELAAQIGERPVEHLVLLDNRKRSVGLKRDALLRSARGEYISFVDDDDWIAPEYVSSILEAIGDPKCPDVVTFRQQATVNGETGEIEFFLGYKNERFKPGQVTKRNAWHVNVWRRSLAILSHFPDTSFGEDLAFSEKLNKLPGLRSVHIGRVLHFYRHSSETTLAPPPSSLAA